MPQRDLSHYDLFAELLSYPSEGYSERLTRAHLFVGGRFPAAGRALEPFCRLLPESLQELQELYTRSFEVQSITSLDIGYVLFGEDYKRGALLANLSREQRQAENDCGTELADYLPNVLRLIPRLADDALRDEMVQELVAPAVSKMVGEFDARRLEKKDELYHKHHKALIAWSPTARTLYASLLQALYNVLAEDFDLAAVPLIERTSDFVRSIATEMNIEPTDGACSPSPR